MIDAVKRWLKAHPPRRRRKLNDFIVAYFVPTYVWQRWACWFWDDHQGTALLKARRAIKGAKRDTAWLAKRPFSDKHPDHEYGE